MRARLTGKDEAVQWEPVGVLPTWARHSPQEVPDDMVARLAGAVIATLRKALAAVPVSGPPIEELIDVSAEEQPEEFTHEVAIDDDLILELPRIVASLAKVPGIEQVWRADREVLQVSAPTWTVDQVHAWAINYVQARF